MSDADVVILAVRKAVKNGWQPPIEGKIESIEITQDDVNNTTQTSPYLRFDFVDADQYWCTGILGLLLDHDFAKALWGDGGTDEDGDHKWDVEDYLSEPGIVRISSQSAERYYFDHPLWMWHLQQMVIADDPIKYLGEHVG